MILLLAICVVCISLSECTRPGLRGYSIRGYPVNKAYRPYSPKPQIPIDCTKLPSGDYPHPTKKCFSKFYSCSNGWGAERTCPEKMVYDKVTGECELFVYVQACGGSPRPETTTTKPQRDVGPDPEFDCTNLANGVYQDKLSKCSRRWFTCNNGKTMKRTCSNDLYYNIETKSCEPWQLVYRCSGKRISRTTPTPADASTLEPVPVNCKNLPSGPHRDPKRKCSRTFYDCTNGNGYRKECPHPTYFNPKPSVLACDDFNNIYECSGRVVKPTKPIEPSFNPPKVYPFNCKNKRDGLYPVGKCQPFYWTCSGGVTEKMECVDNLMYDLEKQVCEQRTLIPKCGGRRPRPQEQIPTSTVKPVNFNCAQRKDGNFAAGKCKNVYITCSGTVAREMKCSKGLMFDAEEDECNHPKFIPNCGGKRPEPENVPPFKPYPRSGKNSYATFPTKYRPTVPKPFQTGYRRLALVKPANPTQFLPRNVKIPQGFYGRKPNFNTKQRFRAYSA